MNPSPKPSPNLQLEGREHAAERGELQDHRESVLHLGVIRADGDLVRVRVRVRVRESVRARARARARARVRARV